MRKLLYFFICAALSTLSASAQTKRIAHRSHSGKDKTFSPKGPDNFGETPEMKKNWKLQAQKDSTEKAKADSLAKVRATKPATPKQKRKVVKTR